MAISAVALFGSRARGDHLPNSDTDLLFVTEEPSIRHVARANLSMSFYPFEELTRLAHRGDLFACHLAKEGRGLYDPHGHLEFLRAEFRLRSSYDREIGQALDLGWYLALYAGQLPNKALVARRVAWCVRTVLIARSAEQGNPVFATHELISLAGSNLAARLIAQKASKFVAPGIIDDLQEFMSAEGRPRPPADSADAFAALFSRTGNQVALTTIASGRSDQPTYS